MKSAPFNERIESLGDPGGDESKSISNTLNIGPANEHSITCSLLGGLVHQREEERPQLVWLRIVPAESANTQSAGSDGHPQLMAIENHARQQSEQRWRIAFENVLQESSVMTQLS